MNRSTVLKSATAPCAEPQAAPFVTARDGTRLFVRAWGAGRPMVFISSWVLNADMWSYQMHELARRGVRTIAYDRRGHGRSDDPGQGYDLDTLTDDLAAVLETLDLQDVTLVGFSGGGAEIVRYLARHGASRVAGVVMIGTTTPGLKRTADCPVGLDDDAIEQVCAALASDFPQWLRDNAAPFVRPETSAAMVEWVIGMALQTSLHAAIACYRTFVEAELQAETAAIRVPTLLIHGSRDMSSPLELTGRRTAALIGGSTLKVYDDAPHGLFITDRERLNRDLRDFVTG